MISDRLKKTILKALRLSDYNIQDETRADQIPGWDSLNHVKVILAIEKEYQILLIGSEVLPQDKVGFLQKIVETKLSASGGQR